jgi:hypothetical protein
MIVGFQFAAEPVPDYQAALKPDLKGLKLGLPSGVFH